MERGLISVDRWAEGSQAYFLTHLHADHTRGLSPAWSRGPLFCSRLSAKLLPFKLPGFDLSLLRVLDVGAWHSLSLLSPSSASETLVRVMPLDAHHCPGAVMYLFSGDFGSLLYTGDFRWETTSEKASRSRDMLVKALDGSRVHALYLDNTYCNPSYSFPSRRDAAQQVVDIIASHPKHHVIIGIDMLGKEDLLVHIARVLKIKIWVWPERLQTMHILGFDGIFTTKTSLARVRAVPRYSFTLDTLEGLNKMHPTIGIMPSGLPWASKPLDRNENFFDSLARSYYNKKANKDASKEERLHPEIYTVPYSDHSCFMELHEFVQLVQPINMRGIVLSSSCYIDPSHYFGHCNGVCQTFQRVQHKRKESGKEHVRVVRAESSVKVNDSKRKGRKCGTVGVSGVYMSRVSASRRRRRGAKIMEDNHAD
ncbi:hypothetical protein EUGRSUZ_A01754 [Eucalyptus grandis]|uniref:Uncharacterized protein n=2 Tax=Eucalyptus grandis TaxID=71139 RepID=A0ACC3M5G9_EUCGR|nr:hypothetical protein EUGRSUZ_A01754 [Eucalyptus grandis]